MRRLVLILALAFVFTGASYAAVIPPAPAKSNHSPWAEKVRENRAIALRLEGVYARRMSPLMGMGIWHARAGRQYDVNPFLVGVAEAIESSFAVSPCGGRPETFNAWGFLHERRCIDFPSWRAGVYQVTRTFRVHYIDKGYSDIWKIGRRYCPPSDCPNDSWARTAIRYLDTIFRSGPGVTFEAAVRATRG